MKITPLFLIIICTLVCIACGDGDYKEYDVSKTKPHKSHDHEAHGHDSHDHESHAKKKPNSADLASSKKTQKDFTWTAPKSWTAQKLSSMRLGSYQIKDGSETGDLSITSFPGEVGGLLANINRWRNEVGLELVKKDQLEGLGETFKSGLGAGTIYFFVNTDANKNSTLVCHHPFDSGIIFVKLSMKAKSLTKLKKEFTQFCTTFKPKEGDTKDDH